MSIGKDSQECLFVTGDDFSIIESEDFGMTDVATIEEKKKADSSTKKSNLQSERKGETML